ncbi:MAG: class I SAM-dependent methyltransferase [Candidatus Heimdallarchaeota archaeon]|nr:MAG: class I SAM-dependent methyltransferase [Candidatus Heimdallarchaeota archaeon]
MTAWEEAYTRGEFLNQKPHPEMGSITELFKKRKVNRILDLGCGTGRHVIHLASRGFDVYGLDIAPTGLAHTLHTLDKKGLTAHVTLHDMISLPYDSQYFDAVISVQVIHHNKLNEIKKTITEITRVLKPKGVIWITVPVSKHFENYKEIEPNTLVPLDGLECGLPHHYFKQDEFPKLFHCFSILDIHVDYLNHYSIIAEKISD